VIELNSCQIFSEAIEAAVPTASMTVSSSTGFEQRLMQRQPRLPFVFLKRDRQQSLGAGGIALCVRPAPRHNQSFRLGYLAKGTLRPMNLAVGSEHMDSIGAASAQIAMLDSAREAAGTHPMDEMLGFDPGFENKFTWRIENSGDDEYAICGFRRKVISCSHFSTP
jgi:hypothetical protein